MMTQSFRFFTPTRIEYGYGKLDRLREEAKGFNAKRTMIVADKGIIHPGLLQDVLASFNKIRAGAKPDEIERSWGDACYRYRYDVFEILIKPPGAKGIQIMSPD